MQCLPGDLVVSLARIRLRPKMRKDYELHHEVIADEILPDLSNRGLNTGELMLIIASIDCEDDRGDDLLVISCGRLGWISAENVGDR